MALKHLTRATLHRTPAGPEEVFIDDGGVEVEALARFRRHLDAQGHAAGTIKRYVEAAARFVDFMIECGAFGRPATPWVISEAVNAYPVFLRDGAGTAWPDLPSLADYAHEIDFGIGLARSSFVPTLAGVNRFLRLAKDEALRGEAALRDRGIHVDWLDLGVTFAAVDGVELWSRFERERFKQQAVMGAVVRLRDRLERPRQLRSPVRGGIQVDLQNKEFPLDRIGDLLSAARTRRDAALWALLAAGGLRLHEALNLRMSDIDPGKGEVWVIDPNLQRFGREMPEEMRLRFKGRTMSRVFLYEPLASAFWDALGDYLRTEFVGSSDDANDFLFQKLDGSGRGEALVSASDTALGKQFKAAVKRAGVPGPQEAPTHVWTPHSLRHSYGIYMLNYIPVPGGPGLRLTEVQMLMGHARIESTAIYARHDRHLLEAKVAAANDVIFSEAGAAGVNLEGMPAAIAARLRELATKIETSGSARPDASSVRVIAAQPS
ncbi:MAG TPA: site-specific integrase [Microvirga sp.]